MTNLALSVLALLSLGSPAPAGTPAADDWVKLDQEINSLSASLGRQGNGIDVGALIRSSYVDINDSLIQDAATGRDIGGFVFQDVDVWLEGKVGDYDWRVSIDFDGGVTDGDEFFNTVLTVQDLLDPGRSEGSQTPDDFLESNPRAFGVLAGQSVNTGGSADLEDAYGTWNATETFRVTFGQFKSPLLLSQMVDPGNQLFINRSLLGGAFDDWQLGAMAHGNIQNFAWFLAIQNGNDGIADDYRYTARAEYYIGEGAGGRAPAGREGFQGAYGASDELGATIGVSFRDDDGLDRGLQIGVLDGAATIGPFSAAAEFVDFDIDEDGLLMAFTLGFMFQPDTFEGALRYEDLDEILDIKKITLGFNYYQAGHRAKWSLNVSDFDSNDLDLDGTLVELGLSLGSSRS